MNKLEGSKTWENLKKAFAGETEAYTKYQYYASKAKKEGLNIISEVFDETAKNEKEHAEIWFKLLNNDEIPITAKNLRDAIKNENYEFSDMYQKFAVTAEQEGFTDIAKLFNMVGKVESSHCQRYDDLLNSLENNKLFITEEPVLWICTNCGHLHIGKEPPEKCPVCTHAKAYFQREIRKFKF